MEDFRLALPRENVAVFYQGKYRYYRIERITKIPPFIKDFGSIVAGKSKPVDLNEFQPDTEDIIYHLRLEPVDDVEVVVNSPPTSPVHAIRKTVIRIAKDLPEHTGYASIATAGTPTELYKVSQNRTAILKRLIISNPGSSGANVYFADSGGTQLSGKIYVPANDMKVFDENKVPYLEFSEDVYVVSDQTGVEVIATFVEVGNGYMPNFTDILISKFINVSLEINNPTRYDLDSSRIRFYGYKYVVEELPTRPDRYTVFSASL